MSASLVGSEMCIRDRALPAPPAAAPAEAWPARAPCPPPPAAAAAPPPPAVSYTHLTLPTICSV
eukprot:1757963-Alexandrium_andersonii.AAC.1